MWGNIAMIIQDMPISDRTKSCLISAGYKDSVELVDLSDKDLLSINNLNKACLSEIRKCLDDIRLEEIIKNLTDNAAKRNETSYTVETEVKIVEDDVYDKYQKARAESKRKLDKIKTHYSLHDYMSIKGYSTKLPDVLRHEILFSAIIIYGKYDVCTYIISLSNIDEKNITKALLDDKLIMLNDLEYVNISNTSEVICDKCSCKDECEYYDATVKPIVKAVESLGDKAEEEFELRIIYALKSFTRCEAFESWFDSKR